MKLNFYKLTLVLVFLSTIDYRFFGNQAGMISFTTTELTAYIVFFLALCTGFLKHQLSILFRLNKYVFWYFVWGGITSLINGLLLFNFSSMQTFKDLIPAFIVFLFIVSCITNEQRLKRILTVYLLGVVINVGIGLLQISYNKPRFGVLSKAINYKLSFSGHVTKILPTGFFSHPNMYALFLLPAALLLLTYLKASNSGFKKIYISILLMLLGINYWYTQAKISLGLFLIAAFFIIFPFIKIKWRLVVSVLVFLLVVCLILFISIWLVFEYNYITARTVITRITLWQDSLSIFFTDPLIFLLGGGGAKMLSLSSRYWPFPSSHNFFLDQILFYGLPALIFFFLSFFYTLHKLNKTARKAVNNFSRYIILFLNIGLITMLANWFFEPAYVVSTHVILFFLFGLATALSSKIYERGCKWQ